MTYDPAQYAAESAKKDIDKMMEQVTAARAKLAALKREISGGGIKAMEPYPWNQAKHCEE